MDYPRYRPARTIPCAADGRAGKADITIIKALGLWHRRVELIEDVRGLVAWLPKGTIRVVGTNDYAYPLGGMFFYEAELPVTALSLTGGERRSAVDIKCCGCCLLLEIP